MVIEFTHRIEKFSFASLACLGNPMTVRSHTVRN
jgi:hypothetical protein